MKIRLALLGSLLLSTSVSPALFAQVTPPPAAAKEETTELGEKMSGISKAFKKLRSQVSDSTKNDDSLMLVTTIRENAMAALTLVPEKTADIPSAEQEKFKADFASRMRSLLADVDKLEAAFKAGNNEEAKALLEVLASTQKEGHKEFKKKKPEKK